MSREATIIEYLEDIASQYPHRIALKDEFNQCTYRELVEKVNLAVINLTVCYGVMPEQRVAILTDKNLETMVGFYAIMKSGAIPLLIDAGDNEASIIARCHSMDVHHVLIPGQGQFEFTENFKINTIQGSKLQEKTVLDTTDVQRKSNHSCAEICYMISTSGTTNIPKGISVTHQNVIHYAQSCKQFIDADDYLVCGHVTNLSTDLGHTNWLMALFTAGTLRLFSYNESRDPRLFKKVIEEDRINFIKTTRSHFETVSTFLFDRGHTGLKYLLLGGEKLHWKFVDKLFANHICENIFNHYGPTETTIGALMYRIPRPHERNLVTESVPVGSAIGANNAYLENVEDGSGELCIEGPGVSKGYYKKEENKDRFLVTDKGRNLYRTGDLCKEVAPGVFEFCNRKDRQVKVNGYRVELEEIEYVISSFDSVDYARLNAFVKNDQVILEAFVKPLNIETFDKEAFLSELRQNLSNHKIPENLYIRESCEYGGNGKINFAKMRSHESSAEIEKFDSWDSWDLSVEHSWKNATGNAKVKMNDDFFETGGNSLKAMKLIAKLQINGYDVGISDINSNTLYADFLALNLKRRYQPNTIGKNSADRNYTVSQQSFFNDRWMNNDCYTQSVLLETSDQIQIELLSKVINRLVEGHLELKRQFHHKEKINFTNDQHCGGNLEMFHLSGNLPVSNQLIQITQGVNARINIARGELFKAAVIFEANGDKKYLYLVGHHLVTDMVSWSVLLDEILALYGSNAEGYMMEDDLKKDFFQMANDNLRFEEFSPIHQEIFLLPTGERGGAVGQPGNFLVTYNLSRVAAREVCQNNEVLICFSKALLSGFGLDKITVDVEFHGRTQEGEVDLSRSVSWWAVTLPVLFNKEEDDSDIDYKMSSCSDYANALNLSVAKGHKINQRKSNVRFNFLGEINEQFSNENLVFNISPFPTADNRDKDSNSEYDLFFTGRIIANSLIIDIQFDQSVIPENKIYNLAKFFSEKLEQRNLLQVDTASGFGPNPSNISSIGKPFLQFTNQNIVASVPTSVMLTGATGYLGIYILRELLLNGIKVHCIVRSVEGNGAFLRLQELWGHYFPKEDFSKFYADIFIYEGDLCEDKFGLDDFEFEKLAGEVEAIIHSAADVNLSKKLEELVPGNVEVVKKLIAFSTYKKDKRLHHVSSLAVSGVYKEKTIFTEDSFEGQQSFVSDYEQSKFLAEQAVRKAIAGGANFKVYRVGHIAGHSQTGKFQYNKTSNRIAQLIEGMLALKAIPYSFNEKISFSYVDIVAKMLVSSTLNKVMSEKACLHLESSHYVTMPKLAHLLGNSIYEIRIVGEAEFENVLSKYLQTNLDTDKVLKMQFWLNRNKTNKRNVHFQNKYSNDLFAQNGLVFPDLSAEWLHKYLQELNTSSTVQIVHETNSEIKI